MLDPVRAFERRALRPLQILLVALIVFSVVQRDWWWVGGAIAALFYLGTIGAKLHPRQTASDLANGPLEGVAAQREPAGLLTTEKARRVGHACTRIAILISVYAFAVTYGPLGLRWYWCAAIAWGTLLLTGSVLKLTFKTVQA